MQVRSFYGVIVKKEGKNITVFANNNNLHNVSVPKNYKFSIEVGEWVEFDTAGGLAPQEAAFPTEVVNGEIHLNGIASYPNLMILEAELRPKYFDVAYSPFIGLLRGAREKFLRRWTNTFYNITAVFDPLDDVLWRVEEVRKQVYDDVINLYVADAPWTLEQIGFEMEQTCSRDETDVGVRSKGLPDKDDLFSGFVYEIYQDIKGVRFYMWSHSIGTLEVMFDETPVLGQWYHFNLHVSANYAAKKGFLRSIKKAAVHLIPTNPRCEVVKTSTLAKIRTQFDLSSANENKGFFFDFHFGKIKLERSAVKDIKKIIKLPSQHEFDRKLKVTGIARVCLPINDYNDVGWVLESIEKIEQDGKIIFQCEPKLPQQNVQWRRNVPFNSNYNYNK